MSALAISWDEWRACYDGWSFAEQQEFYDQVFSAARVQRQFSVPHLDDFLNYVLEPDKTVTVGELGGWDGEFAASLLPNRAEISRWTNYEISRAAVAESVCTDERYEPVALRRFYWETDHHEDLFVASHVLEHLRFRHVCRVFDATDARWLYLQVPLGEGPRGWDGYHGSHILEVGWRDLMAELDLRGYELLPALSNAGIRCFERRG